MTTEDVMDYLFKNRVDGLPHDALADVFDRLIWCKSDNGEAICIVREKWLEGNSFGKCAVALEMSETFPYESISKMKSVFDSIKGKWPQLERRCNEIVSVRIEQNV